MRPYCRKKIEPSFQLTIYITAVLMNLSHFGIKPQNISEYTESEEAEIFNLKLNSLYALKVNPMVLRLLDLKR
jgi:hypothetical protein